MTGYDQPHYQMPLLPIDDLKSSEPALRRSHHVLSYLLHFYAHTVPPSEPILIPRSLTVPLFRVSSLLRHPPILTYSDLTLYNWAHREPREGDTLPTINNLRCQTTFSGTTDEAEFHLASTRIELRGGEALELMRLIAHEASTGNVNDVNRIAEKLERVAVVIQELREILLNVKKGVDPEVFYNEIRPWLAGSGGDPWSRSWIFEGKDEVESWTEMSEVSGATAGQSSLMQALDAYLGIEPDGDHSTSSLPPGKKSFQERMRSYMPRQHRDFLEYIRGNPRSLRTLVQKISEEKGIESPVVEAYNAAVKAMKEFRDAHMVIVTLYVIGPARRAGKRAATGDNFSSASHGYGNRSSKEKGTDAILMGQAFGENDGSGGKEALKGTGGTDLVRLLKGVRDQTARAYIQDTSKRA